MLVEAKSVSVSSKQMKLMLCFSILPLINLAPKAEALVACFKENHSYSKQCQKIYLVYLDLNMKELVTISTYIMSLLNSSIFLKYFKLSYISNLYIYKYWKKPKGKTPYLQRSKKWYLIWLFFRNHASKKRVTLLFL